MAGDVLPQVCGVTAKARHRTGAQLLRGFMREFVQQQQETAGDTLEQAFDNAREAIEAHCELLAEDGQDIPSARPLAERQADPEMAGWVWAMVDAPVERYFGPAQKINITVPARLLTRIDDDVRRHGESRSGFLVRAAQAAMEAAQER